MDHDLVQDSQRANLLSSLSLKDVANNLTLDLEGLNEWIELQQNAKPVLGSALRRTMPEDVKIRSLHSEIDELKREIVRANSDLSCCDRLVGSGVVTFG